VAEIYDAMELAPVMTGTPAQRPAII
jgi:hypothetical protein